MGYCGLDSWGASDNASDSFHTMIDNMVKHLTKELRCKGNSFNTSGPVNVALILRALRPCNDLRRELEFKDLCDKTAVLLELLVEDCQDKEEWGDEDNRKLHFNAYRKMLREVRSFCQG